MRVGSRGVLVRVLAVLVCRGRVLLRILMFAHIVVMRRLEVVMRGGRHVVIAEFPATVIEWLVEDGDPVSAGQPLLRLLPQAAQ